MRIALIAGTFFPGYGYQENIYAKQLAGRDHRVTVVATTQKSPAPEFGGANSCGGFDLIRVPGRMTPHGLMVARGIGEHLVRANPDLVLWFGVGQLFGWSLLTDPRLKAIPSIAFFGENSAMHTYDWRDRTQPWEGRLKALGWKALRGPFYRRVIARSLFAVATKDETQDILLSLYREDERLRPAKKIIKLPLGYDPDVFAFDPVLRARVRQRLGLEPVEVCAVYSSKFHPGKRIERVVSRFVTALEALPALRVMLIGFDGGRYAGTIRKMITDSVVRDRFILQPFSPRDRLKDYFNAADIAVYDQPSISVQEAMGTGLYVLLADDGSMRHLVTCPQTGAYFNMMQPTDMAHALTQAAAALRSLSPQNATAQRQKRAEMNSWLSYGVLTDRLLDEFRRRCGRHTAGG